MYSSYICQSDVYFRYPVYFRLFRFQKSGIFYSQQVVDTIFSQIDY